MRIANNLMAMNAHRQLVINQGGIAKSIEKLSSGLRINRAGDDAAGLSISEKMRSQIRGLRMASKNAQDGISLIQTAEGALTEVHAILQRMRELVIQAANLGTQEEEDLGALQNEIAQLIEEIDKISERTEFNEKKLLDGSYTGQVFQIGANEGQTMSVEIGDMSAAALGVDGLDVSDLHQRFESDRYCPCQCRRRDQDGVRGAFQAGRLSEPSRAHHRQPGQRGREPAGG